jgi:hypothetical protein
MNENNFFEDAYLSVDGKFVGKATMNDFKLNKDSSSKNYDDTIASFSASGTFSLDTDSYEELIKLLIPSCKPLIEEVLNKIQTLKGSYLKDYIDLLPSTMKFINHVAHINNEIYKDEMLILGNIEGSDTLMPCIIHVPEETTFIQSNLILNISLGTTEGSLLTDMHSSLSVAYIGQENSKETRDSVVSDIESKLVDTLLDNEIISSFKGNKLDNSEKRGKKGNKIRNWEKKSYWQKGR